MFVPINLPIWGPQAILKYSTSEILFAKTLTSAGKRRRVIVVYHFDGIEAELQLEVPNFELTSIPRTGGIRIYKDSESRFTFVYRHSKSVGSIILTNRLSSDEIQVKISLLQLENLHSDCNY